MPQFVAQILSLDGYVILSNVDVSIDFFLYRTLLQRILK